MAYAEQTSVSAEKSRAEIESTLVKYGADGFMYGWNGPTAVVRFRMDDRFVEFRIEMPDRDSDEFKFTPARRNKRSPDDQQKVWEQATRQRWRALSLVIKAKLEAVEAGITEFESEFLAHIVLPDGTTAGMWLRPQLEEAYRTGQMPSFLPQLGTGK